MSLRTVPTPPVLPEPAVHTVQAYPLRVTIRMELEFAAADWDELPWWRRTLARWLTGYDWGAMLRDVADRVVPDEDERHNAVMLDREELEARFRPFKMKLTDEEADRIFPGKIIPEKKDR